MQIVYHLGVHATDEDLIIKTLLKNRAALALDGTVIPWPRHYRHVLRDLASRLNGAHASADMQDALLDTFMVEDAPKRVVFSGQNLLGLPQNVLGAGRLYPGAASAAVALRNLFSDHPVAFTFAIRNPASFLPDLFARAQPSALADFLAGTDPESLRWSDMIGALRTALPDCPLTVWCDEDAPVLWPVILQAITGHDQDRHLDHIDDLLAPLLSEQGLADMRAFLAERPPASESHRRRAVASFLEKFARPEMMETEIDMPGWTEDMVDAMTDSYEADMGRIGRIEGVTLLR